MGDGLGLVLQAGGVRIRNREGRWEKVTVVQRKSEEEIKCAEKGVLMSVYSGEEMHVSLTR